jgi:hypothetical protein
MPNLFAPPQYAATRRRTAPSYQAMGQPYALYQPRVYPQMLGFPGDYGPMPGDIGQTMPQRHMEDYAPLPLSQYGVNQRQPSYFPSWYAPTSQGTPAANQGYQWYTPGPTGSYPGPTMEMPAAQMPTVGGGGGAGAPSYAYAPPGIDQDWYNRFQQQHGGATPSQAYGQHGEGLPEAMADLEWSQGFQRAEGRGPTEEEWTAHYYATRGGPRMSEADRQAMRYKRERQSHRYRKLQREAEGGGGGARPPNYIPPQVWWR